MKKYIFSIFAPLMFASTCYAHDPSMMIFLFAQYGAAAISIFTAPVIVIAFCSIKLATAFLKCKSKILYCIFNWILPAILALAIAIAFLIIWISKYGINSFLEIQETTLYFWFSSVAIATIELCLLIAIWYKNKTQTQSKLVNYISKCFNGNEKLYVVFWFWNIVVFNGLAYIYISLSVVILFIFNLPYFERFDLYKLSISKLLPLSLFIATVLLLITIFAIYTYWMFMSIVKSYKNVSNRIWLYPAGIIILLEICYYGTVITMISQDLFSG